MSDESQANPYEAPAVVDGKDVAKDQTSKPNPRKETGLSTISGVFGVAACTTILINLELVILPAIAAVITGSVALQKVKAGKGGGERNAKIGMALGIFAALAFIVLIFVEKVLRGESST